MYDLSGPYTWNEETDKATGRCCFCGQEIEHVNDGGVGWGLEAKNENGLLGDYLYCTQPMCPEARENDAAEIHRCYNPAHSDSRLLRAGDMGEGWRFQDTLEPGEVVASVECGSYLEFLGDRCPECGGLVADVDARLFDPTWEKFFKKKEA
jgi:hypothetical protein